MLFGTCTCKSAAAAESDLVAVFNVVKVLAAVCVVLWCQGPCLAIIWRGMGTNARCPEATAKTSRLPRLKNLSNDLEAIAS